MVCTYLSHAPPASSPPAPTPTPSSSQSTVQSSHKCVQSHVDLDIDGTEYLHLNDEELLSDMAPAGIDLEGNDGEDDENDKLNVLSYVADGINNDEDDEVGEFEDSWKHMHLEADEAWQMNCHAGRKRAQELVLRSWNVCSLLVFTSLSSKLTILSRNSWTQLYSQENSRIELSMSICCSNSLSGPITDPNSIAKAWRFQACLLVQHVSFLFFEFSSSKQFI